MKNTQKWQEQLRETGYHFAFATVHPQHCLGLEQIVPHPTVLTRLAPSWSGELSEKGVELIVPKERVNSTLDLLLAQSSRDFLASKEDGSLGFQALSPARATGKKDGS